MTLHPLPPPRTFAADATVRAVEAQAWPDYAELHCLSAFSFQRGASLAIELFERAKVQGYRALAITDSLARVERGSLFTAARTLWVAAILARTSLGDSADRVVARALATVPAEEMRSMLLVEAANIRLIRGDPDSALALIAVAVRMNRGEVPYISAAPWFDEARKDPRFGAALGGISPREAGPRR